VRISDQHVKHWLDHGYAVVEGFLTSEELADAQKGLGARFPTITGYLAAPELYRTDRRGGCMREAPYLGDALNRIALHPEIISFVERALDTPEILLVQSLVWAKYPGVDDFEQPLHTDYPNTTLMYPPSRGARDEVTFILYYQDVDEQLGPTHVVSTQHDGSRYLVPNIRPRHEYPELYARQRPVHVPAGSLLIYHMGTFHRASQIRSRDRARFSHHFVYRAAKAHAVGYRHWANYGLSAELRHLVESISPRQREVLGFAAPGDAYWTEETLRGIAGRYPNMDMTPYVEAAELPAPRKAVLRGTLRQLATSEAKATPAADYSADLQNQLASYYAFVTGIPATYWLPWISWWTNRLRPATERTRQPT
jgi:ectoine hydroxylase-related dioxygenase (phytanoyl-CoA dioxygenase family)